MTLTPQEIRTAMFPEVLPVLREMAESQEFLRVTRNKIPTKRQEDKDFVSRFIAFYILGYQAYKSNMDIDTFVNESMQTLRNKIHSEIVNVMKNDFVRSLLMAEKIFGNDAFRKRYRRDDPLKPLNKAYFEVLTTTFAKLNTDDETCLISRKELLKDNLIHLMNDDSFATSISTGTGRRDRVHMRFNGVENAIKATLENKKMGEK